MQSSIELFQSTVHTAQRKHGLQESLGRWSSHPVHPGFLWKFMSRIITSKGSERETKLSITWCTSRTLKLSHRVYCSHVPSPQKIHINMYKYVYIYLWASMTMIFTTDMETYRLRVMDQHEEQPMIISIPWEMISGLLKKTLHPWQAYNRHMTGNTDTLLITAATKLQTA